MVKCREGIFLGVAIFCGINTCNCMDYKNNIIDYENKNSIINYESSDVFEKLSKLKKEYDRIQEKIDLINKELISIDKETGHLGVSPFLFKDSNVRECILSIKQKASHEKRAELADKENFPLKIESAKKKYSVLTSIVRDSNSIRNIVYKRILDKNQELKSDLFKMDEKISEAQVRTEYLKNMWWLEVLEKLSVPNFEFPLNKSANKNVYQLFDENDFLKETLEKKQAKLQEIEKQNKQLEAEIYGCE